MCRPSKIDDRCVDLRRSLCRPSKIVDRCVDLRRSMVDVSVDLRTRGPQLVVCAYEISKSDEYNEIRESGYTRIYCSLYGNC